MSYTADKFQHNGYTVRIIADEDAQPPEQDDEIFLITTSNRYFEQKRSGFEMDDARDGKYKRTHHVYPLYMYQHSGTALSLEPFTCPWDSGQVGFVLVSKRRGLTGKAAREMARTYVESWHQYVSGDVWGYTITDADGEQADSCWGIYGQEYAVSEAKAAADGLPACPVGGAGEDDSHEETLVG